LDARASFLALLRLFNKKHILWLIPIALLLAGCAIWNVPVAIFWEIALVAWFSIAPGYALVRWIRSSTTTLSQQLTLSCAFGIGITVLVTIVMHRVDAREYSALTVSIVSAISIMWSIFRERRKGVTARSDDQDELMPLLWIATVCCLLAVIYNFSGFHFTSDGELAMRGLFAIDVPYLIGNMPSIDLYGRMHDMHQNGLWFPYHDHIYRFISVPHQVDGTDYFSLIAYSFPFFGRICAAISVFAIFRIFFDLRVSFAATLATIFIASSWGDHILTGALSPSYLAGMIYAAAVVLLCKRLHEAESKGLRIGIWVLLGLSQGALAKTKLPLFAIVGGSIGLLSLMNVRRHMRTSTLVIVACVLSLAFAVMTSGSSPYQPANDFVIGAPLQGFANHFASLMDVSPSDVDAIITPKDLEASDLLVIPYTILHFLRMIVFDARLLIFLLTLVATRGRLSESETIVKRFGITASVIGVALPVLYTPSWYPLAISFYTPEIAGMIALLCSMILLIPRWKNLGFVWTKRIIIGCAAYGVMSTLLHVVEQSTAKTYMLRADEVRATDWIRQNTDSRELISSTRTDLDLTDTVNDESFYLYGALTQRRMISEGAEYGALLSAVADRDTVKGLHPIASAQRKLYETRSWSRFKYLITQDALADTSGKRRAFASGNTSVWSDPMLIR
jgi:hypothetical protein